MWTWNAQATAFSQPGSKRVVVVEVGDDAAARQHRARALRAAAGPPWSACDQADPLVADRIDDLGSAVSLPSSTTTISQRPYVCASTDAMALASRVGRS